MGLKDNKGITLIEIVVSIAILGIIVTPLSSLFVTTVRNNSMARDKMIANQLAQKYMEVVMLDIKKDGAIPVYSSPWDESGFEITANIEANNSYEVRENSGSTDIENYNASISAAGSLANEDYIEVKDNKIKHKTTTIGNYTNEASDIKLKITSIDALNIAIDIVNQSEKKLNIYKVYSESDNGNLDIHIKEGEVYIHENIMKDSGGSTENENRNYLCKIIITVKKNSKELVQLASYKTND